MAASAGLAALAPATWQGGPDRASQQPTRRRPRPQQGRRHDERADQAGTAGRTTSQDQGRAVPRHVREVRGARTATAVAPFLAHLTPDGWLSQAAGSSGTRPSPTSYLEDVRLVPRCRRSPGCRPMRAIRGRGREPQGGARRMGGTPASGATLPAIPKAASMRPSLRTGSGGSQWFRNHLVLAGTGSRFPLPKWGNRNQSGNHAPGIT